MARTVTVHRREGGGVSVRCGDDVIGFITRLEGNDEQMTGSFARGPGYDTYAHVLAARERAEAETRGIHVFSAVHEMRIDEEETLIIDGDTVRFRPTSAFVVLRSGGLG